MRISNHSKRPQSIEPNSSQNVILPTNIGDVQTVLYSLPSRRVIVPMGNSLITLASTISESDSIKMSLLSFRASLILIRVRIKKARSWLINLYKCLITIVHKYLRNTTCACGSTDCFKTSSAGCNFLISMHVVGASRTNNLITHWRSRLR